MYNIPEMLYEDETKEYIKDYFNIIDEQLKTSHRAIIIFSNDFFYNSVKMLHWYYIGEVLKKKYGYVTLERFNTDFISVEEQIQNSSPFSLIISNVSVKYFKYYIYNNSITYFKQYNGYNQRFDLDDTNNIIDNKIIKKTTETYENIHENIHENIKESISLFYKFKNTILLTIQNILNKI